MSNTLGRLFWNFLFDFKGFKFIMASVNTILLVSCISLLFFDNEIYYFAIVIIVYSSQGVIFGIMPTHCARIYGPFKGTKLYPFIYFGFSGASLTQFFLHLTLVRNFKDEGFKYCFMIYAFLQLCGLVTSFLFRFEYRHDEQKLFNGIESKKEEQ